MQTGSWRASGVAGQQIQRRVGDSVLHGQINKCLWKCDVIAPPAPHPLPKPSWLPPNMCEHGWCRYSPILCIQTHIQKVLNWFRRSLSLTVWSGRCTPVVHRRSFCKALVELFLSLLTQWSLFSAFSSPCVTAGLMVSPLVTVHGDTANLRTT